MMKTFRLLLGFIIIFPMICPAQKKGTAYHRNNAYSSLYRKERLSAIAKICYRLCAPLLLYVQADASVWKR